MKCKPARIQPQWEPAITVCRWLDAYGVPYKYRPGCLILAIAASLEQARKKAKNEAARDLVRESNS